MINAFRSIQLFLAAYEEGSFTAAAIRENATQPGISQHIINLEETLGVKLFRRGRYDVSPTPAADIFYRYCLEALRALEAAREAVQPFADSVDGEITVGLTPTLSGHAFPAAFARFMARYPNIRVSIQEFSGPVVRQRIRAGKLDFAVTPASARSEGLKQSFFAAIPEVLVSGPRAGRRHMAPVTPRELDAVKLVLPPRGFARRVALEAYLNAHGARIAQILEMNSLASLSLVEEGEWTTILPVTAAWASNSPVPRIVVQPLVDPTLSFDWVVVEPYQKDRSEAAELFISYLADEVRGIIDRWREAVDALPETAPE
jgi:DNA-binding transcriptional LysR family regulator